MNKIVGLPVIVAIILGWLFPYTAVQLMPFGVYVLFLLMLAAGLGIDWDKLRTWREHRFKLFAGIFLLYVFFPLIQWFLAKELVQDKQILHGLIFASLCPVAIVAPYFASLVEGDAEFSFSFMVASMLLCPLLSPFMLNLLSGSSIAMDTLPLMKYMLLLVTLPLLLSFLTWKFLPNLQLAAKPYAGVLNIGTLSVLVFILFGTAAGKLNTSYDSILVFSVVLSLAFFQDFGVLVIARFALAGFYDAATRRAMVISLSMKNVAIAAGLLLFYDPRAALPAALIFLSHAFLFNFIAAFRHTAFFAGAPTEVCTLRERSERPGAGKDDH